MPVDLPGLYESFLLEDERPGDGLLHASSHLVTPLRHVQLEMAGVPQTPRSVTELTTLKIGTLMHDYLEEKLQELHYPLMTEVKLNEWLPDGWGGTADYVIWHKEYKAFVLGDLKTVKAAGMPWILEGGAKESHLYQISAYWYALRDMGLPLVKGFGVLYLPKDDMPGKTLVPTVMECDLVDESILHAIMEHRHEQVQDYLEGLHSDYPENLLAPVPDRELKRIYVRKDKKFDVVLKSHWSAAYCRFPGCGCGEEGQTRLGGFELVDDVPTWVPRKGQEDLIAQHDIEAITPRLKEFR